MEVRKNLPISKHRCDFVAYQAFIDLIERSALERVAEPIETQGHAADRTDAERRAPADARLVQRDLCCRRGEGEIAAARTDLMKAHSDARVRPDGKPRAGEHGCRRERRRHCPGEEFIGRSVDGARSVATDQGRPESDRNQHDLCGGIRIGQRSSDGAAGADRGVTHMRHDFREQRQFGPDKGVLFQHIVFGRGTDRDRALLPAHEGELSEPRDINEPPRTSEPHGHQRHQRLAPRDNTRFVCGGLVQHRAGLVEVRGTTIFE
jgi:hypothetical protein